MHLRFGRRAVHRRRPCREVSERSVEGPRRDRAGFEQGDLNPEQGAISIASVSTSASSAHLLAAYAPLVARVMRPRTLDMNSNRPLPRSRIVGKSAWAMRIAPTVF